MDKINESINDTLKAFDNVTIKSNEDLMLLLHTISGLMAGVSVATKRDLPKLYKVLYLQSKLDLTKNMFFENEDDISAVISIPNMVITFIRDNVRVIIDFDGKVYLDDNLSQEDDLVKSVSAIYQRDFTKLADFLNEAQIELYNDK